ncbi:unnamed protein product, partial [Allacma fusca]
MIKQKGSVMKRQRLNNTGVALKSRRINTVRANVIHGDRNSVYVNHEQPVTRIRHINNLVLHFTGRSNLLDTTDLAYKSESKEKSLP